MILSFAKKILPGLLLTGGILEAVDFFSCDFTEMTGNNGQKKIIPIAKKENTAPLPVSETRDAEPYLPWRICKTSKGMPRWIL